jgi:hypothetical protein
MNRITDTFATIQDNLRFLRIRQKYKIRPGGGRKSLTLHFTPDRPVPSSIVHKLCALNGYRIISHPARKYDMVFRYRDATFYDKSVEGVPDDAPMINRNAVDISKKNVDRIFSEVFGYSLILDPSTHRGKAVEKSDANAQHDGRIIQCPVPESSIRPGCVYQRIIDNRADDNQVRDLRIVVHGYQIPLVYQKYRPVKTRFSNTNTRVELGEPSNLFSTGELDHIRQFAKILGVDYGELDILRDNDSGLIYIVDANLTPWGPPNGLSFEDRKKALEKLIVSFREIVEIKCRNSDRV